MNLDFPAPHLGKARIINQNEWRIVGMSRSGNHAIINWLLAQTRGKFCFLNCAEPKTNPFHTARPLDSAHDAAFEVNYRGFKFSQERSGRFTKKDYLVYSYEDCFLGSVYHPDQEIHHNTWVGASANRTDILILRDPFNLFASRRAFEQFSRNAFPDYQQVNPATGLRIWKQHAKESLQKPRPQIQKRLVILYNRWVRDPDYRRQIATSLGLTFDDARFEQVTRCAGGSSFDGLGYQKQASQMKVLERWKNFAHEPGFQELFDPKVIELSEEIFGKLPGTELFHTAAENTGFRETQLERAYPQPGAVAAA
jgi:hypothetical protein